MESCSVQPAQLYMVALSVLRHSHRRPTELTSPSLLPERPWSFALGPSVILGRRKKREKDPDRNLNCDQNLPFSHKRL